MAEGISKREIGQGVLFIMLLVVVGLVITLGKRRETASTVSSTPIATETATPDTTVQKIALRPFEPNTVSYEELLAMGMTRREAVGLVKYRATGKVFRIAEDVALCYALSDSAYQTLKPYIRIGEQYRIVRYQEQDYATHRTDTTTRLAPSPFRIDTVTATYLRAIGALTKRQAEAFIRWRDRSGSRDMEEVRACYVVDDSVATALEPYILFPERDLSPYEAQIEINKADSAQLVRVVGIGPKTAAAILNYRERLGGFVRIEQLAEVKGVMESNYEKILQQICCKDDEIRKIDINFATPSELDHPYIGPQLVRKIIKHRQLKGGWTCTQELVETDILTREEAARLDPYVVYGVQQAISE
ncbi:MAG: helix-hairpin-helix domain-containing protein [Alistipes sp.]|nr:helix-hairpin-helix domain-containing protein [Alistipes sp.]